MAVEVGYDFATEWVEIPLSLLARTGLYGEPFSRGAGGAFSGHLATGIVAAAYGGYLSAGFDTWRRRRSANGRRTSLGHRLDFATSISTAAPWGRYPAWRRRVLL